MTAVSVTAGHIAKGIPGDACGCAVALAVIDAFPDAENVSVGDLYVAMYIGSRSELLPIPENVRALITVIDRDGTVEPFTFELDYPAAAS